MGANIKLTIIASLLSILLTLTGCGFFESDEGITAAVRAGDPSMCAQLEEDDSGHRIDKCYSQVGEKIKDPSVCKKIRSNDYADDCYSGIAVKTGNVSLCGNVINSKDADECVVDISTKTGDETTCLHLTSTTAQQDCVYSVAINNGDFEACSKIKTETQKLACQTQVALSKNSEAYCNKIESKATRESCKEQLENKGTQTDNTCEYQTDCDIDEICTKSYCVKAECTEDTSYCNGNERQFCDRGKMEAETCEYGCKDRECLTKADADKEEQREELDLSCNEGYSKCLSETSIEFCQDDKKTEGYCEFGCKRGKCMAEPKVDISGTIASMQDKADFASVVSGPYMDALDKAIESETDASRLAGLEAYKEWLDGSAEEYGETIATLEDLEKLKRIFIDQYDPSMDIENMKASDILAEGLGTKITNAASGLIDKLNPWAHTPTIEEEEQAQAEEQLKVYQAMLERQAEIDFLKKSRLERIGDTVAGMVKDKLVEEVSSKAKDLAETAGGTAFAAVGYVDEALQTVQDEAQNMMFTGLIKAYDRRRAALEAQYPDKSNEEIHQLTVSEVEDFPYADAKTGVVIAKYGNLLANEDCTKDDSNPLCVDRHAFWVAMDKSYEHFNDRKLFDRWLEQNKPDE
ncbi:hypothetical protein KY363_00955 [Candidatus Woesearchaeota archaeon]|nr:hypothetical protein [Candidatus Woesearchaeota archaeon]